MILRIAHICLNVADLKRTIAFYQDKLGLPIQFKFERGGRMIGAYFRVCPGNYIEAFENPGVVVQNTGIVHICLEVEHIDETIARLKQAGVACTDKTLGADRSYQAWIQDPDENRIELHEYTDRSAQKMGGAVEV